MLNLKRLEVEGKIRTHSNMLISEFIEGGSLDNWVFNIYENDLEISNNQWKYIVFQLIYTIAVMQHYYRMMHNDFHYGNILIDDSLEPGGYLVYEINNKTYYIPSTGVVPLLWDFEFAMSYSDNIKELYPNKFIIGPYSYDRKNHKTIINEELMKKQKEKDLEDGIEYSDSEFNVPYNYNEVYDVHYFLTSLLDLYISQELFDWIVNLYPNELIPDDVSSSYTLTYSSSNSSSDRTERTSSNTDTTSSYSSYSSTNSKENSVPKSKEKNDDEDDEENEEDDEVEEDDEPKYLNEGRLINGAEGKFELPTPIDVLNNSFFECFTVKPDDFDPSNALYFKAGF